MCGSSGGVVLVAVVASFGIFFAIGAGMVHAYGESRWWEK